MNDMNNVQIYETPVDISRLELVTAIGELCLYFIFGVILAALGLYLTTVALEELAPGQIPANESPLVFIFRFPQVISTFSLLLVYSLVIIIPFANWVWQRNKNRFWNKLELRNSDIEVSGFRIPYTVFNDDIRLVDLRSHPASENCRAIVIHAPAILAPIEVCLSVSDAQSAFEAMTERCTRAAARDEVADTIVPPKNANFKTEALVHLAANDVQSVRAEMIAGIVLTIASLAFLVWMAMDAKQNGPNRGFGKVVAAPFVMAGLSFYRFLRWRKCRRLLADISELSSP